MPKSPQILTVVEGSEDYPRHGGATIVELASGATFLAWMEISSSRLRAGDDAPSDIVSLQSTDGGRTWGGYRKLIERGPEDTAVYKPSLLRLKNGAIAFRYEMYHRFVQNEPRCISAYFCTSRDECKTFSDPFTIWSRSGHHTGSFNDVRQLSSGRIIVPTEYVTGNALQDEGKGLAPTDTGVSGCFYSDDDGRTWKQCDEYVYLPMRGAMESKVEEISRGRILMVLRTQLGSVFKSISGDGGRTWSKPQTTGLMAPESCPALLRIPQTRDLLIVWNHSPYDPKFDHYGLRSPLSVAVSKDDGETWGKIKNIETDPEWEFTNPAPFAASNGTILIAYEASKYASLVPPGKLGRSRMSLKLAIFELDWLYA
jgi:sialidase-1